MTVHTTKLGRQKQPVHYIIIGSGLYSKNYDLKKKKKMAILYINAIYSKEIKKKS